MNVQAEKLELIEWLTQVVDVEIIERIKALKEKSEDSYFSLSKEESMAITEALEDIEAGRVKPHKEVMAEMKARYQL